MTLRQGIRSLLIRRGCMLGASQSMTATGIAKAMRANVASIASIVKKMADAGELHRIDGVGPRGGSAYQVIAQVTAK